MPHWHSDAVHLTSFATALKAYRWGPANCPFNLLQAEREEEEEEEQSAVQIKHPLSTQRNLQISNPDSADQDNYAMYDKSLSLQ